LVLRFHLWTEDATEPTVNIPFKNRAATICAGLGVVLCGGAATANAANVYSILDADLRDSVQFALHADPYFYDGHVQVTVDHGVVHLRGMVFSDWDLRDAMRIASKAAGDRTVVDNLTIVEGGKR
jgi:BON domain